MDISPLKEALPVSTAVEAPPVKDALPTRTPERQSSASMYETLSAMVTLSGEGTEASDSDSREEEEEEGAAAAETGVDGSQNNPADDDARTEVEQSKIGEQPEVTAEPEQMQKRPDQGELEEGGGKGDVGGEEDEGRPRDESSPEVTAEAPTTDVRAAVVSFYKAAEAMEDDGDHEGPDDDVASALKLPGVGVLEVLPEVPEEPEGEDSGSRGGDEDMKVQAGEEDDEAEGDTPPLLRQPETIPELEGPSGVPPSEKEGEALVRRREEMERVAQLDSPSEEFNSGTSALAMSKAEAATENNEQTEMEESSARSNFFGGGTDALKELAERLGLAGVATIAHTGESLEDANLNYQSGGDAGRKEMESGSEEEDEKQEKVALGEAGASLESEQPLAAASEGSTDGRLAVDGDGEQDTTEAGIVVSVESDEDAVAPPAVVEVSPSSPPPPPLSPPRSSMMSASLLRQGVSESLEEHEEERRIQTTVEKKGVVTTTDSEADVEADGRPDNSRPGTRLAPIVLFPSHGKDEPVEEGERQDAGLKEEPAPGALLLDFPRSPDVPGTAAGLSPSLRSPGRSGDALSVTILSPATSKSPAGRGRGSGSSGSSATLPSLATSKSPHRQPLGPVETRRVLETSQGPVWSPRPSPRRKSVAGTGQASPDFGESSTAPPRRMSRSPVLSSSSSAQAATAAASAAAAATVKAKEGVPTSESSPTRRVLSPLKSAVSSKGARGREGRAARRDSSGARPGYPRSVSSSVVVRASLTPSLHDSGDAEQDGGAGGSGGGGRGKGGRRGSGGSRRGSAGSGIGAGDSDALEEGDAADLIGAGKVVSAIGAGKHQQQLRRVESLNNLKEEGEEYGVTGERSSSIEHDGGDALGIDLAAVVTHLKEVRVCAYVCASRNVVRHCSRIGAILENALCSFRVRVEVLCLFPSNIVSCFLYRVLHTVFSLPCIRHCVFFLLSS